MEPDPNKTPEENRHLYLQGLVMRQTDYDAEVASQKLKDHNNDILAIVREYMGPPQAQDSTKKATTNQQIFTEIRTMMDDAAATYRVKKALEERQEAYKQHIMQQQGLAAQRLRSAVADPSNNSVAPTEKS